ncbi:hypothetical protein D3C85_1711780 [compost metagenome]
MATIAPAGPVVPVAIAMPRQISSSCTGPACKANAADNSRQLPRQKPMARLTLRSGELRHRRSLSMPHRIMPAPLHNTMTAAMPPALSVGMS